MNLKNHRHKRISQRGRTPAIWRTLPGGGNVVKLCRKRAVLRRGLVCHGFELGGRENFKQMEHSSSITMGNLAMRDTCTRVSLQVNYSINENLNDPVCSFKTSFHFSASITDILSAPTKQPLTYFSKCAAKRRRFPDALSQRRSKSSCLPSILVFPLLLFVLQYYSGRPLQYWKALQVWWGRNTKPINMSWIKEISVIITTAGTSPNTAEVPENWFVMFTQAQQ